MSKRIGDLHGEENGCTARGRGLAVCTGKVSGILHRGGLLTYTWMTIGDRCVEDDWSYTWEEEW